MRNLLFAIAVVAILPSAIAAPPKNVWDIEVKPAVVVDLQDAEVEVGDKSIAKINGEWREVESRQISAVLSVPVGVTNVAVNRVIAVDFGGSKVDVIVSAEIELIKLASDNGLKIGVVAPAGRYQARLASGLLNAKTIAFEIGQPPAPTPPDPPQPSVAPFESEGFAVLIVREAQAVEPAAQEAIYTSSKVQQWINSRAVKISDNGPFFRVWDDDYTDKELENAPPELLKAYLKVRKEAKQLPWIAISTGKGGFAGPLPADIDAMITLLEEQHDSN